MRNTELNRKIHCFFEEYVDFDERTVNSFGLASNDAIKEAAKLMLSAKVFLSIKSLKLQALKDYNIILPDWIFEK